MDQKVKEILIILQEESAEVIQQISKIQRFGLSSINQHGVTNQQELEKEIGDLLAMIDLLKESGIVSQSSLDSCKMQKIEKLHKWSNIFV
jgi:NTP pyrophosphatase (non-canonical NTP hydrolase)